MDGKDGFVLVCCSVVVIILVDIDIHKDLATPQLYSKEKDPAVAFPIRENLTDNPVCSGTAIFGIWALYSLSDDNPFGIAF